MSSTTERRARSVSGGTFFGRARLVALVAVFFFSAVSAAAKPDFSSLSVRAADETVFAHAESEFVLSVPGVEPDKVQTELLELPGDVRFISSKKESDACGGTVIHFWLSFSSVGLFSLPPISLRHGFRTYSVPFGQVAVTENPALLSPRLFVRTDGAESFSAGESIVFTVYAQYVGQLLDFGYKLPRDSIFLERERFFSGKDDKKRAFSSEAVPLARFEWKPLRPGEYDFPDLFMDAVSYSGSRKTVRLSRRTVSVSPAGFRAAEQKNPLDGFYDFAPDGKTGGDEDTGLADETGFRAADGWEEGCARLQELRTGERYGFPLSASFSENRESRRNLERQMGITLSEDEKNVWVMDALFAVTGIFFVLSVLFLSVRRTRVLVVCFSLFVLSLSVSFVYEADFAKRFGIFSGGSVSVIPEELSDGSGRFVPAGLRVKIIEKSSDWVYIETVDCSGWVRAERVKELM